MRWDLLMAGGGLAGLSLAHRITRGPLGQARMAVVDRSDKAENDRTFAFWSARPGPFDGLAARCWRQLRVVTPERDLRLDLGEFHYRVVRGLDLYRHVHGVLAQHPNVALLRGEIDAVEDGAEHAVAVLGEQRHAADWIFDSRFVLARDIPVTDRYTRLVQRFSGVEVETDEDRFDPDCPLFMDFRAPQVPGDLRFLYVLPYTARRALVELVSLEDLDEHAVLDETLRRVLGLRDWRVLARERGVSPLSDRPFPRRLGRRVLAIGVRGGQIKPTTGYAYTRIQADSEAIARSLEREGHPFAINRGSRRYRLYDAMLLHLMQRQPGRIPALFGQLFGGNPARRVLRFLDEEASFLEDLLIMRSLPTAPFLGALGAVLWRRLARTDATHPRARADG